MAVHVAYPMKMEAELDAGLSRWLWLVKWFLVIPHVIVLAFLWIAYFVLSVVAFFGILISGRYPRGIFDFNVGVLRWSWRVSYYAYGALGTDRYPPFTLQEVPDYPTHLEIAYPGQLSRGLVLVKWWLLAIPHYLVVGVLVGGAYIVANEEPFVATGVIGLLVLIAAFALLFTGRYPRGLFDLVLGLNRWVLRVAAYASLMTDEYPPFRLDMGGSEGSMTAPPTAPTSAPSSGSAEGKVSWGPGRVISLVLGAILALGSFGFLAGGGVLLWADRTQRDDAGFVTTPHEDYATSTYALVSEDIRIQAEGPEFLYPERILGDTLVRVESESGDDVFVGIAPTADVERYLDDVAHDRLVELFDNDAVTRPGSGTPGPPSEQSFWTQSTRGAGERTLRWEPSEGDWSVVVMNDDASSGVAIRGEAGAEIPALLGISIGLLVLGALGLGLAALILFLATRARRS